MMSLQTAPKPAFRGRGVLSLDRVAFGEAHGRTIPDQESSPNRNETGSVDGT